MPLLMKGDHWDHATSVADKAIDDVGLEGKYHNLPSMLSGGEQQRVAIARAIAGNPKILFADEPTANLDSVSSRQIIDLIAKLHDAGQTVVMVTHEPEYTDHCNRIVYIEDGQVVDEAHK